MPMSLDFTNRLSPVLKDIADHFGTPFHIYDEKGIQETGETLKNAFGRLPDFREFFAVKALPNPAILKVMKDMGFGFDCSSIPELVMSREIGACGHDLMFTSNNTHISEFEEAAGNGGAILNLDDISLVPKVPDMPELICFRYNPGERRTGNSIIGNPLEAKYGVAHDQIIDAYKAAEKRGAVKFGIHTMLASNERNYTYMVETTRMLLSVVEMVSEATGRPFEFINIGGGLGIPYTPGDEPLDIQALAEEITEIMNDFGKAHGYVPKFFMESGRYMTGPHGALVTRAINSKNTYRHYVGVDACMSSLMRPGIYGAYHHITVHGKETAPQTLVADVVGALCENNDKFAIQRPLPDIADNDLLLIHDTGAHGYAMGFNYNGRLRPKELLLKSDGSVELIRREETIEDHFATFRFDPDVLKF